MSYCVNCGVELGESEKKCVLCNCEVVNPKQKSAGAYVSPYPVKTDDITTKENRKFYAILLSALFALPSIICFFLNILYFKEIFWSIYVISVFFFIWVCTVIPILLKKLNVMVYLFFDYLSLIMLVFIIENFFFDYGWFLPLAFPMLTSLLGFTVIMAILIQKHKIHGFQIPGMILILSGFLCAVIDFFLSMHFENAFRISWSIFTMVPTIIVALIFFIIEKNDNIKEELIKRFHF
jgi:hypothetical protein